MISLTTLNLDEYVYILMDEPENSLHADAQHLLRKILEELGKNENIQVIYATHSPSMINSVNPKGVRLLKRASINDKATTIIDNNPIKENFSPIRVSLGLTPSDSLLYAPITIITEGDTEIKCLTNLFRRFYEEKLSGFEDLDVLLPLCHFIDAQGDKFIYWCRLVKSQGCQPILFVDGDKINRVKSLQTKEDFQDIPIVTLDEKQEFEDIVSEETYFQALKETLNDEITYEAFEEWIKEAKLHEKTMFSKKVEAWLKVVYPDTYFSKAEVMQKALALADIDDINTKPFIELVSYIREAAKKLS